MITASRPNGRLNKRGERRARGDVFNVVQQDRGGSEWYELLVIRCRDQERKSVVGRIAHDGPL